MFQRATSLADAFITAAVKQKVDHQRGTGNWIARRAIQNCERTGFGVITEYDRRPQPPKKELDAPTIAGINAAIDELVEIGMAEKMMPRVDIEA